MTSKVTGSAFWGFSLRFYALPGVAPACIDLQDRHGADVNVLLFLLFLAGQGRLLSREDVSRIDAEVRAWREGVVAPLREARRRLRDPIGSFDRDAVRALRTEVKRIELEAERVQQETLERAHPAAGTGATALSSADAARANLAAYGMHLGELPDERVSRLLQAFDAAFTAPDR